MFVLETCLKSDSKVLQNCFICDRFVPETGLKCDPNMQFTIDAIFRGCVSSDDFSPTDHEKTVLPDIGGQASATNGLSDMNTTSKTHRVIDPLRQ
jgi:hypothetical protein